MNDAPPELHCPRMSEIARAVCDHYGLTQIDFYSDRRARKVSRPRQVAMWIARQMTIRSLPEIARFLRRGDHTTVIHGIRTIEGLIDKDEDLVADIHAIRRRIHSRVMLREAFEQSLAEAA